MIAIVKLNRQFFSDFIERNQVLIRKVSNYKKNLSQHQKVSQITQEKANKFINQYSKQQVASKFISEARYDKQFNEFITDFNKKHKGSVSLLDFSNYATSFGELKQGPIKKSDLDLIRQFQKRKVDQKIHNLRMDLLQSNEKKNFNSTDSEDPEGRPDSDYFSWTKSSNKIAQKISPPANITFPASGAEESLKNNQLKQGPFYLNDNFVMLLLHKGISTQITTLNRINSFRSLVFMGNGNGVIAYGKGKGDSMQKSLIKAVSHCKMNLIAIPLDQKCTLPKPIYKKFQDYRLYLRPIPGFNSWGHPTMATMLALTGFKHLAFKTIHTQKNVYDLCNVFFKAVTKNTTPKELAEQEGWKVYRHQFVRPLTESITHRSLSN